MVAGLCDQEAACSVRSAIALRLLPSVVPSVVIHTSTVDMGAAFGTGIVLWPGCISVGGVSSMVSDSSAGVGVGDDRICTSVPVLGTSRETDASRVACGSCSSKPTPLLKPGNGTASLYISVVHPGGGEPLMASPA